MLVSYNFFLFTFQNFDFLLDSVGSKEEYEQSEKDQTGPKMSQFVVDALPNKERKKGTSSELYIPESMYYQTAIGEVFQSMMVRKSKSESNLKNTVNPFDSQSASHDN